ncbi:MAG: aspartyl protease family protein [Planctomycetota bacterium]|nr:aspartyl protease family protein [Planctomycetota bacterium]MDA1139326.1 aspartyl protease family protein [Planctomycetota bacterium]
MRLNFNSEDGCVLVPTQVSGPSGKCVVRSVLDTGAMSSMVSRETLLLLGYDIDASETIEMTTGSGKELVPGVDVLEVYALGIVRKNLKVICHTLPPSARVDGVHGFDFFNSRRLLIDFAEEFVEVI